MKDHGYTERERFFSSLLCVICYVENAGLFGESIRLIPFKRLKDFRYVVGIIREISSLRLIGKSVKKAEYIHIYAMYTLIFCLLLPHTVHAQQKKYHRRVKSREEKNHENKVFNRIFGEFLISLIIKLIFDALSTCLENF
jgi:hypothetical protein